MYLASSVPPNLSINIWHWHVSSWLDSRKTGKNKTQHMIVNSDNTSTEHRVKQQQQEQTERMSEKKQLSWENILVSQWKDLYRKNSWKEKVKNNGYPSFVILTYNTKQIMSVRQDNGLYPMKPQKFHNQFKFTHFVVVGLYSMSFVNDVLGRGS